MCFIFAVLLFIANMPKRCSEMWRILNEYLQKTPNTIEEVKCFIDLYVNPTLVCEPWNPFFMFLYFNFCRRLMWWCDGKIPALILSLFSFLLPPKFLFFQSPSSAGRMIFWSTVSLLLFPLTVGKVLQEYSLFLCVCGTSLYVIVYVVAVQNQKLLSAYSAGVSVSVFPPYLQMTSPREPRGWELEPGYSFISEDWDCGEEKREGREEGAEIGRRWRRGNGANRVDKSGCGVKEDKAARKENGNGEMKWKSKLKVGEREHSVARRL